MVVLQRINDQSIDLSYVDRSRDTNIIRCFFLHTVVTHCKIRRNHGIVSLSFCVNRASDVKGEKFLNIM